MPTASRKPSHHQNDAVEHVEIRVSDEVEADRKKRQGPAYPYPQHEQTATPKSSAPQSARSRTSEGSRKSKPDKGVKAGAARGGNTPTGSPQGSNRTTAGIRALIACVAEEAKSRVFVQEHDDFDG